MLAGSLPRQLPGVQSSTHARSSEQSEAGFM